MGAMKSEGEVQKKVERVQGSKEGSLKKSSN